MLNFDANATYGLIPEVQAALCRWSSHNLNPSSIHTGGQNTRLIIEEAREALARAIGAPNSARVIFTSGGTEANNGALMAAFWRYGTAASFISTTIEHSSVLEPLLEFRRRGCEVTLLTPGPEYLALVDQLVKMPSSDWSMLSIMLANNETGELLPIKEIVTYVRERSPHTIIHCDATQALGKVQINFDDLNVDMLTVSGHKIGALSGVGALIVRKDLDWHPLLLGGPQELRWRAGTENALGIASFGIAAKRVTEDLALRLQRLSDLRDSFERRLCSELDGLVINRAGLPRLPNTSSITVQGVRADDLVVALDLEGICISSGAACASGKPDPSHVLLALGFTHTHASESIRVSFRDDTTMQQLDFGISKIVTCINKMRADHNG